MARNPQKSQSDVRKIIDAHVKAKLVNSKYDPDRHLFIVAIRGYYLDSMGKPGKNDRRVYDDAFFVYAPNLFAGFQANTDPNGYRAGKGFGSGKGMACLEPGVWYYATGPHRGRPSFRQADKVTVMRDGNPPYEHTGWHAINIHSGGNSSTSSLGCQTVPASTWRSFKDLVYAKLEQCKNPKRAHDWTRAPGKFVGGGTRSFPYIVVNETDLRKGNLIS